MIPIAVIRKLRLATCAVLRLDVKHEDAIARGGPIGRLTGVRATAFLVRESVLLTNRHVVELIAEEHSKTGNHDHWYVEFGHPRADGNGWSQIFRRIKGIMSLANPSAPGSLDVGLLSIRWGATDTVPAPVELGDVASVVTGAAVAICGYPFGDEILIRGDMWRFGSVVHAGIVSGISPYDGAAPRDLTTFLTDINTAGGMSGSPVFMPDTGFVIGLHYAGVQGTLGCAVPVDEFRVAGWVRAFEAALAGGKELGSFKVTGGGDVSEEEKGS